MKAYLIIALLVGSFGSIARADHKSVTVHVNGMVCSFCSQGLTKKFKGEPTVSNVNVDLDKKVVTLALKHDAGDLTDEKITDLISSAGFNVEKIERN